MRASSRFATRLTASIFAIVTAASILPEAADARDMCRAGCYRQSRRCVGTDARAELLGCKFNCVAVSNPLEIPACLSGCVDDFRGERRICREERDACTGLCDDVDERPEADRECVQGCGEGLAICSKGVIADGRDCVVDCADDDIPPRAFVGCVQSCVATARESAGVCAGDFRGCVRGCGLGGVTTTTLP